MSRDGIQQQVADTTTMLQALTRLMPWLLCCTAERMKLLPPALELTQTIATYTKHHRCCCFSQQKLTPAVDTRMQQRLMLVKANDMWQRCPRVTHTPIST